MQPLIDPDYAVGVVAQVEIAQYHLRALRYQLEEADNWQPRRIEGVAEDLPPVEVQAHLESVLIAVASARDKLLEGIAKAHGKGTDPSRRPANYDGLSNDERRQLDYVSSSYVIDLLLRPHAPAAADTYDEWKRDPLVKEAMELRRRAVHHVSTKRLGTDAWEYVRPSRSRLSASFDRRVLPYAESVVGSSRVLDHLARSLLTASMDASA